MGVLLVGVSYYPFHHNGPTQRRASGIAQWFATQKRVGGLTLDHAADNSILVVKFTDYQCPPCKRTFEEYGPLLTRYKSADPARFKFVNRDFPLDGKCNPHIKEDLHPSACEAAIAVRVVRRAAGDPSHLEEWLYANQRTLSDEAIWAAAQRLAGVTPTSAERELALAEVRRDIDLGTILGVRSTSTFFVNGVMLQGAAVPLEVFDVALNEEARRSGVSQHQAAAAARTVDPRREGW